MSHTKGIFGPPACLPNNGGLVSCRILLFCSVILLGPPLLFFQEGCAKGGKSKSAEADLLPANETAFEGGLTGTAEDTGASINRKNFRGRGGKYDIPTGSKPSPLFGAKPFTQQMLRFEEFGSLSLPEPEDETPGKPFPAPSDARSGPQGNALDDFLAQEIFPFPTRKANETYRNPWQPEIEEFLGRPRAEGQASGAISARGNTEAGAEVACSLAGRTRKASEAREDAGGERPHHHGTL